MIKPNEDSNIIKAIINLSENISWREIVKWIEDSLNEQSRKNNHAIGEATIKGQGRCLELEDILRYINNARHYEANKTKQ